MPASSSGDAAFAREFRDVVPPPVMHRMGRMAGLVRRLVLGYVDGHPEVVAAVVTEIAGYDDLPGRWPYPAERRFDFPFTEIGRLVARGLDIAGRFGRDTVTNAEAIDGARPLLERLAPPTWREQALALLDALPADQRRLSVDFPPAEPDPVAAGPVRLCAAGAIAAWIATDPRVSPSRESGRLLLLKEIRDVEAAAIGAPPEESVADIDDDAALALLADLFETDLLIPRDPARRGLWELDIIALLKAHLLAGDGAGPTPQQADDLKARIMQLLTTAEATARKVRTAAPAGPRRQPRRTTRQQRRTTD